MRRAEGHRSHRARAPQHASRPAPRAETVLPGALCARSADAHTAAPIVWWGRSAAMRTGLGDPFVDSYLKLRTAHWQEFQAYLSPWEVQMYLDS